MSNHWGSYMLNEVIGLLNREEVFDLLGKTRTQRIVLEMLSRATEEYDCNPGEVLKGFGATLGLCYYCRSPSHTVVADLCQKCRAEQCAGLVRELHPAIAGRVLPVIASCSDSFALKHWALLAAKGTDADLLKELGLG